MQSKRILALLLLMKPIQSAFKLATTQAYVCKIQGKSFSFARDLHVLVAPPPWQQVYLLLHQQLTGFLLPSQLLARAVTGPAAAEVHQSGVMVGPALSAASEFQFQSASAAEEEEDPRANILLFCKTGLWLYA